MPIQALSTISIIIADKNFKIYMQCMFNLEDKSMFILKFKERLCYIFYPKCEMLKNNIRKI